MSDNERHCGVNQYDMHIGGAAGQTCNGREETIISVAARGLRDRSIPSPSP